MATAHTTSWTGRTATEIAAAVRGGEVTAAEVVRDHLDRIAKIDPELNAFAVVRAEKALAEAEAIDAASTADLPLAGVPVAAKDNLPVAGEPMRSGSPALPDKPQEKDHPVVARLRAAGAVVVGITNMPELGTYSITDGMNGITRNPWDRKRTPGGSSGGAAVAVATGMVPIAIGNDGLGSIRNPAACCGLLGLKPGQGLVPAEVGPTSWHGIVENGPIATTAEDTAHMLAVMADQSSLADPPDPGTLRLAASAKLPLPGGLVRGEYKRALRAAGETLSEAGHTVDTAHPPYPWWVGFATLNWWFTTVPDELAGADPALLAKRLRRHAALGRRIARFRPPREETREKVRAAFAPFFEKYDVLLMPVLAQRPPRAVRWHDRGMLRNTLINIRYTPFSGVWNIAGYAAASVPIGCGPTGLPGSVQLIAPPGRESMLLGVARQIERDRPWRRHAPDYQPALDS